MPVISALRRLAGELRRPEPAWVQREVLFQNKQKRNLLGIKCINWVNRILNQ